MFIYIEHGSRHLFEVFDRCPALKSRAFAIVHFCLNVDKELISFLLNWSEALAGRMRFFTGNDSTEVSFGVAVMERIQSDILMPLMAYCDTLAALDFISSLR